MRSPAWSPDARQVVYEKVDFTSRPQNQLLYSWDPNFEYRYTGIFPSFSRDGTLAVTDMRLLERAPDPAAVLKEFVDQFTPHSGWRGSLAATLEANATLLDALDGTAGLASAIAHEKERLRAAIEQQRGFELSHDRERDERFE